MKLLGNIYVPKALRKGTESNGAPQYPKSKQTEMNVKME